MMTSWLLTKNTAERFFGKDVTVETVDGQQDVEPALTYNVKKLENYLKTGQSPTIGKVVLSAEEFVRRVLSNSA